MLSLANDTAGIVQKHTGQFESDHRNDSDLKTIICDAYDSTLAKSVIGLCKAEVIDLLGP